MLRSHHAAPQLNLHCNLHYQTLEYHTFGQVLLPQQQSQNLMDHDKICQVEGTEQGIPSLDHSQ